MPPLLDINDAANYNSVGAAQSRLNNEVSQIAPLAPSWHVQQAPGLVLGDMPYMPDDRSNIAKVFSFVGRVGSEIGSMSEHAATWLAQNTANLVKAAPSLGVDLSNIMLARYDGYEQDNRSKQLGAQLDTLGRQYKSGQINAQQYVNAVKAWQKDNDQLERDIKNSQARLSQVGKDTIKDTIDTAAAVTTFMTAGVGGFAADEVGVSTAVKWLSSDAADAGLLRGAANLSKLVSDGAFSKLTPEFQSIINRSLAEVAANSTVHLTAEQMGRAAITNLALKYPIYYNYLSTTGADVYNKLDKKEYGGAVQQVAYNAALMLSGGPIGYAMKYGGKAVGRVVGGTFVRTPFVDELSRLMFGDAGVIYNAVNAIKDPALRKDVILKLSHAEATNLGAVGENEIAAAANRVVNGMEANYAPLKMTGLDPSTAHDEIMAIYNHFQAQELFSDEAKRLGIGDITAGRWDARSISQVTSDILQGTDVEGRLTTFDNMIKSNSNQPWANNPYLIKQIKGLIKDNPAAEDFQKAMQSIKARPTMPGFSKEVLDKGAKLGYTPINVPNMEAPFRRGSGKLVSRFASPEDELFVRASQPLPVLQHVGAALTSIGLSPYAASARVNQLFTANLAENIKNLDITQSLAKDMAEQSAVKETAGGLTKDEQAMLERAGVTPELLSKGSIVGEAKIPETEPPVPNIDKATDYIIKKLSNTAKSARIKALDLRQLRVGEIERSLNVSRSEAKEIQDAISQAMRSVPLQVRGLGDKLVDISYGAIKQYLRLQGSGRFAYNPFYRFMRLEPKTEILSEAQGGGIFKSIFGGRWSEVNPIRTALRDGGFLDKTGGLGDVFSGEAVESTGASRNLIKQLTANQERSIAGLVDAQARRMGMDWQEYIKAYPDEVKNTIQAIAEYDRNADFLNSPMIRTLNIAIFPFRFETKVVTMMAQGLARTSMMTQVAFVNGLMRAHDWLNSPEGHAWYQQNSEAIQLFGYITPLQELNRVFNSLLPGHDHSIGNFGELGGLPFGFIPQLLDAEGFTNFNPPGINPKTGDPFPKYIPADQKGQAAIALQDFIGTLWSYPGATAGLPSKTGIDQSLAMGIVGGNKKTDLKKAPSEPLNAQQQQYKNDIQPAGMVQAGAASGPPPQPPVTVPATGDITLPVARQSRSRTLKKTQFSPQLLPGQTEVGQLP